MAGPDGDLKVRALAPGELGPARQVLTTAYGEDRFSEGWARWKHTEGPWGPSRVLLAELAGAAVGVVCSLPWRLTGPDGEVDAMRLVDGGTTPAAQGRGVFGRLAGAAVEGWRADGHAGVVWATATPTARRAHLRNGATALDPVAHAYGPVRPRPVALDEGRHLLDQYRPGVGWQTAWVGAALRWRFDPRSGQDAEVVGLRHADHPTGAVVRRTAGRAGPVLVVELRWGPAPGLRTLLGGVAWRHRTAVALAPVGPGAAGPARRAVWRRSSSLLCVWDTRPAGVERGPLRRPAWTLSLADLGGVI